MEHLRAWGFGAIWKIDKDPTQEGRRIKPGRTTLNRTFFVDHHYGIPFVLWFSRCGRCLA